MTTIAVSIDRILEGVYAHSAAHNINSDNERPEILGRDHKPMLRVLCRATLSGLAMTMGPALKASNLAEEPMPDIIKFEMTLPQFLIPDMLRAAIETAVAAGVLAKAWGGSTNPIFGRYTEICRMATDTIRGLLASGPLPGAISPTA